MLVGHSRVRHGSWPFWRASPHRAVAHAFAARNGLAPPHRRCTRVAQVPAESAEVEATDVARSAARRTVKSHGPSRRPGRRVHSPNWASRRGSKQALHSLAHLVLLSLASGFRIPRDAPGTSDGSCSGGSCGVGRRQLSVGGCDGCDDECGPCNGQQGGGGTGTHCSKSCNHHPSFGSSCSGVNHDSGLGIRNDGPCNAATIGDCKECNGDQDCDDDVFLGAWCIAWCDAGCNQGCTNDCDAGCDQECDEGCSCPAGQYKTGATKPRHSSPVPHHHHHHHRLSRHHAPRTLAN